MWHSCHILASLPVAVQSTPNYVAWWPCGIRGWGRDGSSYDAWNIWVLMIVNDGIECQERTCHTVRLPVYRPIRFVGWHFPTSPPMWVLMVAPAANKPSNLIMKDRGLPMQYRQCIITITWRTTHKRQRMKGGRNSCLVCHFLSYGRSCTFLFPVLGATTEGIDLGCAVWIKRSSQDIKRFVRWNAILIQCLLRAR